MSDAELFDSLLHELDTVTKNTMSSITVSEFKKFIPLFKKLEGPIPINGSPEFIKYQQLSMEYSQRVNLYGTVNIIDDTTKEIIAILPPMYKPTNLLSSTEVKKNADFVNLSTHDFPGVADKAHMQLQASFIQSQNFDFENLKTIRATIQHMNDTAIASLKQDTAHDNLKMRAVAEDEEIVIPFEIE